MKFNQTELLFRLARPLLTYCLAASSGATKDQDCHVLFITNKKFTIHFVGDKDDPCALEMSPEDLAAAKQPLEPA